MSDPITELVNLRAWMLHRADDIEAVGELPARKRGPEAARIAERIRNAVSAPHLVKACERPKRYAPTDPVPRNWMEIGADEYPLCPRCHAEVSLVAARDGRRWICDECVWQGECHA